jgi:mannose-6-phosphate isomerase
VRIENPKMEKMFLIEPLLVEKVWGGERLTRLLACNEVERRKARYGEAWLLYFREERSSIVRSGANKGKSLAEIAKSDAIGLLGRRFAGKRFPLICKFICADSGHLSVQLHPDKAAIERFGEKEDPKDEIWYIVEALRLPSVAVGLKQKCEPQELLEPSTLKNLLNQKEAEAGEMIRIAPGVIHSLFEGTLVFEVSSNSDITYRLYDWGREGREMHQEKVLSSLSNECTRDIILKGEISAGRGNEVTSYVTSLCTIEQVDVLKNYRVLPAGVFRFGVVIWGEIECEGVNATRGDSFFIPASAPAFDIVAKEPSRFLLVTP